METPIVIIIIFLFVYLNSLTYIIGALATPMGGVFLGTVHWTGDYFYYLSQFAQGTSNWFFSYDLYTADFRSPVLVGWVNVFLGRLFYLIGINQMLAYQLSVVIFAATFLGVSYFLIREIFPKRDKTGQRMRIVAFVLFVASNAFPKIIWEGGRWSISHFDFWFNTGLPFNRLGGVPHHLIARTSVSLALLLGIWWWKITKNKEHRTKNKHRIGIILGLVTAGFILASVEPVHWIITSLVLFISIMVYLSPISLLIQRNRWKERMARWRFSYFSKLGLSGGSSPMQSTGFPHFNHSQREIKENTPRAKNSLSNYQLAINNIILFFPPLFFFFLSGLPMAIYLKKMFSQVPYLQLAVWEDTQQLHINFIDFILGNGPVAVLAIFGIFFFIRRLFSHPELSDTVTLNSFQGLKGIPNQVRDDTIAKLIAIVFTILSISLYFSPIPGFIRIVNVRFLPSITTLFLACMATEAIFTMAERFARRKNLAVALMVGLILLITLPATVQQLQARTKTDPGNAFFYVSKEVIEAYKQAQKISSPKDTFLVIWPFNWSFPGITGRRVYEGHNLLTVDYDGKEKLTSSFFFTDMSREKMQEFLLSEKIDYVLAYPWTRNINQIPVLEKIYDNQTLAIYKMN